MRMLPARYQTYGKPPLKVKAVPMSNRHVQAPLKGLSLAAKLGGSDPLVAPILTNYVVEDDRIDARAGYRKLTERPDGLPVETLVPLYGEPSQMMAASGGKLWDAFTGIDIKDGYTGNDWSWTSFSNLGDRDYTVLCNGHDGVWSWDGSAASTDPVPVAVTNLSNTDPAVVTVAAADIAKFSDGMIVWIAGVSTLGLEQANGARLITSVDGGTNTFALVGIDGSTATAPQTAGITAEPPGTGLFKEFISPPPGENWINPDTFNIVLSHMNRLWFADTGNLAVYYLPLMQKAGELRFLPLNVIFKRGGTIRAMYTWSLDAADSMNSKLAIFTSNGECAIYSGTDPDSDFGLDGLYRFDAPMSKHAVVQYGAELYVLVSTGLVPMSTLMRAQVEQLGQYDKNVISFFLSDAVAHRAEPGWQAFINPSSSRVFCNIPLGGTKYTQFVRHMPRPVWSHFENCNARHWCWIDPYVYFGTDDGKVHQMHPSIQSDDGEAIRCDVQAAWRDYGYAGKKHFKLVNAYYTTNGSPVSVLLDVAVDYDYRPPENQPEVTGGSAGTAKWNTAKWNEAKWVQPRIPTSLWTGVAHRGLVGAPRMVTLVKDCSWSVSGWDIAYEEGSIL